MCIVIIFVLLVSIGWSDAIGFITDEPEEEDDELDVTDPEIFRCDYTFVQEGDGWFKIHPMPLNFSDAYMVCIREGGILASPINEGILYAMLAVMNETSFSLPPRGLRTGFSKLPGGFFISTDGHLLSNAVYLNWDYYQPDNINNSEHCINFRPVKKNFPNGSISDEDCSYPAPFMCHRRFEALQHNECGNDMGYVTFEMVNITEKYDPCYKYYIEEVDKVDFLTANKICMGDGGHLAHHVTRSVNKTDYLSPHENPFIAYKYKDPKKLAAMVWVGFTSNYYTEDGGDDWVAFPSDVPRDKAIEEYFLKDYYYPMFDNAKYSNNWYNYYDERYFCGYFDGYKYGIMYAKCDEKRFFLCERPRTRFVDCKEAERRDLEMDRKIRKITAKNFRCDYKFIKEGYGWYKMHTIPLNFTEARLTCKYEGGVLASPNFKKQRKAMVKMMANYNIGLRGIITGINAFVLRQYFHSLEGIRLEDIEHEWDCDQPDNINNNQQCIYLRPNGKLSDEDCSETAPFICFKEFDVTLSPPSASVCGTTDVAYAKPEEPKYQYCYKIHFIRRNWYHASLACNAEGGSLIVYENNDEFEYVVNKWYLYPPQGDRPVKQYFMGYAFYMFPSAKYQLLTSYHPGRYFIGASKELFGRYNDVRWLDGRLFFDSRIFPNYYNMELGSYIETYPIEKHKFCMSQEYKNKYVYFEECEFRLPFICKARKEILKNCPKPEVNTPRVTNLTVELYSAEALAGLNIEV